jgi:hypothetical protein
MDLPSLTLFGQALGDGLGNFLLHKPRIATKIHKALECEELHLHLSYGEFTQVSLHLNQLFNNLEQSHYSAEFSQYIQEQLPLFPKEHIRDSHYLFPFLSVLKRQQNESLNTAILFASLCTRFHSIEQFLPWLIGYAGMLNKKPYAIAGHIFFGFYIFCRHQGDTPEDFIHTFSQWRKSSQALQSPVPDQIYWAYQQALWIGLNYSRRPMMEFIGQHLAITLAAPNVSCALSMLPFAIVLAEDKKNFTDLCLYLCEPGSIIAKSDLMVLAMLSAQVIGTITTHIPKWISIHNQKILLDPIKWNPDVEIEDAKPSVRFPPPKQEEQQLRLF